MSPRLKQHPEPEFPRVHGDEPLSVIYLSGAICVFAGTFFAIGVRRRLDVAPAYLVWRLISSAISTIAAVFCVPMWSWTRELGKLCQTRRWLDAWVTLAMTSIFAFGSYFFLHLYR